MAKVKKEIKEFKKEGNGAYFITTLEGYQWWMPKSHWSIPVNENNGKWFIEGDKWSWNKKLEEELDKLPPKIEVKESYTISSVISRLKDIIVELEKLDK